MKAWVIASLLCLGNASSASGQSIEDDIYVRLYAIRKARAELAVKIVDKEVWFNSNARDRGEQLYVRNAMSLSEFDIRQRDYDMSLATKLSREAEVREADTLLMIATDRVSIGLIPPICLELR